jgi:hypothetical protein
MSGYILYDRFKGAIDMEDVFPGGGAIFPGGGA